MLQIKCTDMIFCSFAFSQVLTPSSSWSLCYISLLRCNYYEEYLACEQEDFCERYIKFKGSWELLSGERLVILLKITQLQLNSTWEAKPVLEYESSCFRKKIDLLLRLKIVKKTWDIYTTNLHTLNIKL